MNILTGSVIRLDQFAPSLITKHLLLHLDALKSVHKLNVLRNLFPILCEL